MWKIILKWKVRKEHTSKNVDDTDSLQPATKGQPQLCVVVEAEDSKTQAFMCEPT